MNHLTVSLKRGILDFLDAYLPQRTKRLIFLASFSARLKEATSLDQETMRKLNDLMVLCNTESAMMLPVQLSKTIWHGKSSSDICQFQMPNSILSSQCIDEIAAHVHQIMPRWLRYDTAVAIQSDVKKLLAARQAVLGI